MSDARWIEIEDDVTAATRHFGMAVKLHAQGGFDEEGIDGYSCIASLRRVQFPAG